MTTEPESAHETQADNGNQFGRPGRKPFYGFRELWMKRMEFLNAALHGAEVTEEFMPLLTGERLPEIPIATADATLSFPEGKPESKIKWEIIGNAF